MEAYSGLVRMVYSHCSSSRAENCLRRASSPCGAACATSIAVRMSRWAMRHPYARACPAFHKWLLPRSLRTCPDAERATEQEKEIGDSPQDAYAWGALAPFRTDSEAPRSWKLITTAT